VRPARPDDLEWLVRIEVQSHPDPWSRESMASFLADPQVVFLVVEAAVETGSGDEARGEATAPVTQWVVSVSPRGFGILRWAADQGEVVNLAVAPAARGRGAGSILLESLLESARGLGLVSIFLEVRESNVVAIALYHSRGFRDVGVRRQYYSHPVEDARVLQLSLGPAPSASPERPSPSEEP